MCFGEILSEAMGTGWSVFMWIYRKGVDFEWDLTYFTPPIFSI